MDRSRPQDTTPTSRACCEAFTVPGVGIAIVKDGKVVLAKGYGVRRLGDADPGGRRRPSSASPPTPSSSPRPRSRILVEEGRLEWDAPVIRYLPWFALYDPYVTRELTVRDLLVHRSGFGLGAGDLLWWPPTTYDRAEIARRLRFIRPATSFRSAYAYDNVLYLVAGEVIEAVSGQSWEDFIRTRILDRLGMSHSDVHHSAAGEPRQRRHAPRRGGRHRPARRAVRQRQHQSGRRASCPARRTWPSG